MLLNETSLGPSIQDVCEFIPIRNAPSCALAWRSLPTPPRHQLCVKPVSLTNQVLTTPNPPLTPPPNPTNPTIFFFHRSSSRCVREF